MRLSLKWLHRISALTFPLILATSIPAFGSANPSESIVEDMNADALLLITYVLLALGLSFLCSVAEAVLLSITPSYIEEQKEKRPKRAALLKRLKQDNVDRSLAAILTLNTIAHTGGAIGAGAKATVVFGSAWFEKADGIAITCCSGGEGSGQMTEDRGQKTEDRFQVSRVRCQLEVSSLIVSLF